MPEQDSFDFDNAAETDAFARRDDPDTSQAAADSVKQTELESVVLADLQSHGPATSEEVAERTGIALVSVSPRFRPLAAKGFIETIGKKPNHSKRMALIWQAKERLREKLNCA
jgi:predicted ArsR family transcriptional regulator